MARPAKPANPAKKTAAPKIKAKFLLGVSSDGEYCVSGNELYGIEDSESEITAWMEDDQVEIYEIEIEVNKPPKPEAKTRHKKIAFKIEGGP